MDQKASNKKTARMNRFAIAGISIFVCAWMFVLGIWVGRGTAPVRFDMEKLQKELTSIKEAVIREEARRVRISPAEVETGASRLGFYEELEKTSKKAALYEKKPQEAPVIRNEGKYTVQVASLKDPVVAKRMADSLAGRGYPVYITRADVPGRGIWHRVRIGSFASAAEARAVLKRLLKERIKGIIVRR